MVSIAALFTDIDRCYVHPKVPEPVTIALEGALRDAHYKIVLLTGKYFEDVMNLPYVPYADIIVTGAGTEIFVRDGEAYKEYTEYANYLSDSRWNRENVIAKAKVLILELKHKNIDIQFQQNKKKFKVSCNLMADTVIAAQVKRDFLRTQSEKIIFSGSHEVEGQYKIDIVPLVSGKEGALRYIVQNLLQAKIGFVAGNSGNDFEMLQEGLFPAILVGGASSEALSALEPLKKGGIASNIYSFQSKSGTQKIYVGDNTELGPLSIMHALANPIINSEGFAAFSNL